MNRPANRHFRSPKLVRCGRLLEEPATAADKSRAVTEGEQPISTSSEREAQPAKSGPDKRLLLNRRVGPAALIALAALVGLVVWLVVDSRSSTKSSDIKPEVLTLAALKKLAAKQPIYWVGARRGARYEITKNSRGTYLRYLPAGAKAGDKRKFLTIATYPFQNAYAATKTGSKGPGTVSQDIPGGGVATYHKKGRSSVYVAYPGTAFQIEVYDPHSAVAQRLANNGSVQPVIQTVESQARGPLAASPADLRSLATTLGHPIYWAGPRPKTTYELWQTPRGLTYIRYLPLGVQVGGNGQYLIVGTYPMKNAFTITRSSSAKSKSSITRRIPDGGIAAYSKKHATNVYVAYPGVDVQIEVYDPSAKLTPRLVVSGQIVPVR
jgi:hypothetical protein